MESAKAEVKTRYVIYSEVKQIDEHSNRQHIGGVGPEAVFTNVSLGWFLYLNGSRELIHLGYDKPALKPGDKIKITLEKVT